MKIYIYFKCVSNVVTVKKWALKKFIQEGFQFRSCLFMTLIWLPVFWWILDYPNTVKEKTNLQLGGFRDFFKDTTTEKYTNCVFREIPNTSSPGGPSKSNRKRRSADILNSDDSGDEDWESLTRKKQEKI